MTVGDAECLGIGAPFVSGLGMRCTFRAVGGEGGCQSSDSIDHAAGLTDS